MRLLIGKLHEAWELFRTRVCSDRTIAAKYPPNLSAPGAPALQELNRHFGRRSTLTAIRNKISFHYSDKDNLIESNFQQLPASEPLHFYLSKTDGNSFYYAAELIVQLSAISQTKAPVPTTGDTSSNAAQACRVLCNEIIAMSANIMELFGQLISILAEPVISKLTKEEIPDGPKLATICLPYFTDENPCP